MDPLKDKSVEILRVMALSGSEGALDELLRRKDNEKDDAVAQARYEVFMVERACIAASCTRTCRLMNTLLS